MGNYIDLTGKRFGKLIVLSKTEKRYRGSVIFKCKCDCGKITYKNGAQLRNGTTKSCGCLRKEKGNNKNRNLINQIYGELQVVDLAGKTKNGRIWKCKCSCGNYANVLERYLLSGETKSCGCRKYAGLKTYNKNKRLHLEGKKFGKLTVLEFAGYNANHSSLWECRCDCGNKHITQGSSLLQGLVESCGCLSSKAETEIKQLFDHYNIKYKPQYTFKDLKGPGNGYLRFDFGILWPDDTLKMLVEFQGKQHYLENCLFGKEQREITDKIKKEYCRSHNIPLFEITYKDNITEKINELMSLIMPIPCQEPA